MTRRLAWAFLAAPAGLGALLGAAGCQGGNFSVLGYTTEPPFDPSIRTVYLPLFKNTAFHTNPYRGIEIDITQAVGEELASRRTHMKVVDTPAGADTELLGNVTIISKGLQNRTLLNFNREFDVIIGCEVVWRDLRSGQSLGFSRPRPLPAQVTAPFDPSREAPPPPPPDIVAPPLLVFGYGRVIPELGESNTTGAQAATRQVARQIVNMMERPW